ncbi:MAG: hypothetical protein ABI550_09590, partial [Ignavibacteriaceae bacterium]
PNKTFENIVDSLFNLLEIDTSKTNSEFLAADIKDNFTFKSPFTNNGCTDYLIYSPLFKNTFSLDEFYFVTSVKDSIKKEEILFHYLEDNDITESLNKVYVDSLKMPKKIERLSTEVNLDFGEVISTLYYKNGLLALCYNNECFKRTGKKSYHFVFYKQNKLEKEISLTEEKNILKIETFNKNKIEKNIFIK